MANSHPPRTAPMTIRNESELEDRLSEPSEAVIATFRQYPGDIVLLGAAGKMGLSLARMARRAADAAGTPRQVIAVSRFSSGGEEAFHAERIETIRCDLLAESVADQLPDAPLVVHMPGRKFGSREDACLTWAINVHLPSVVCQRYRTSRIVAFSTGNVYPLVPVTSAGSQEADRLNPVGEYGMSALGRERMFEYYARTLQIPVAIIRLNYACDLRYGVLVDLARAVLEGQPIDLRMGHFNTIWQGDANAMTLRVFAFAGVPARAFNVTGPEVLSVRAVCQRLGEKLGKTVRFEHEEADTALLSDARASLELLSPARVSTAELIDAVADWIQHGGRLLGKPTHFAVRDGQF